MATNIIILSWSSDTDFLKKSIASLGCYEYLFDNVYLLNSDMRSSDIRDFLKSRLPESTSIYVSKLSKGSAWFNVEASNLSIKALYNDGEE